jgi:thioredoxin reductase (NADPH)
MTEELYDCIIIGGGAAGLTAGIYTGRKKMKTLLITVDVGGQNLLTESEENYPGYLEKSGPKLMQIFQEQAINFGTEIVFGKANKLEKVGENFRVTLTNGEQYLGKTVILAFGKVPRTLGVPGEDKFIGRGVSTCANCDAPFAQDKIAAVVGGGNSAFEAAELLTKFAKKVYLIHRRDEFRADPITVDKVKAAPNVEFLLFHEIREFRGEKKLESIIVEDTKNKIKKELQVDMVFLEIGQILDTAWVKHLVKTNAAGEIIINKAGETSAEGIFAAGDVTDSPYKQTVTAAAEGAIAALSAYNYLRTKEGKPKIKLDWD